MENKKYSFGYAVFIVALVAIYAYGIYGISDIRRSIQQSKEDFYAPVMVTDSAFHVNLSEKSCVFAEIKDGSIWVHSNSVDVLTYNGHTHVLEAVYHNDKNLVNVRDFDIQSILGCGPVDAVFEMH